MGVLNASLGTLCIGPLGNCADLCKAAWSVPALPAQGTSFFAHGFVDKRPGGTRTGCWGNLVTSPVAKDWKTSGLGSWDQHRGLILRNIPSLEVSTVMKAGNPRKIAASVDWSCEPRALLMVNLNM